MRLNKLPNSGFRLGNELKYGKPFERILYLVYMIMTSFSALNLDFFCAGVECSNARSLLKESIALLLFGSTLISVFTSFSVLGS
jgi:hypothetical protein